MTPVPGPSALRPAGGLRSSRQRARQRRQNLLFYASMLCVFVVAMLESCSVSFSFTQDSFTRPAVALGFVCVFFLMNDKEVFRRLRGRTCLNIWAFWGLLFALMLISAWENRNLMKENNPLTKSLAYYMFTLETICLMLYALAMDRTRDLINFMLLFMAGLIALTDTLMLGGIHFSDGAFETYLVGTKFDAIYLHLNFSALFLTRLKLTDRRGRAQRLGTPIILVLALIILIIGLRVDCNTGILGALMLFFMIYACERWPDIVARPLSSPRAYLLAMAVSVLFAYCVSWILNIPVVAHLIVDKMGRSLTLTGRTIIYAQFPGVMHNRWSWGFGYGSAYQVCWRYMHFADVQNALLQWILQVGMPATAALVALYGFIMTQYRRKNSLTSSAPILMLVYMYIMLGMVEITFNNNFFLWMMMLFLLAASDPKKVNDEAPRPVYRPRRGRRRRPCRTEILSKLQSRCFDEN